MVEFIDATETPDTKWDVINEVNELSTQIADKLKEIEALNAQQ